jgi:hypothetical protein
MAIIMVEKQHTGGFQACPAVVQPFGQIGDKTALEPRANPTYSVIMISASMEPRLAAPSAVERACPLL